MRAHRRPSVFSWLGLASRSPGRTPQRAAPPRRTCLEVELLEDRTLLSSTSSVLAYPLYAASEPRGADGFSPRGLTPAELRHAYSFDQLSLDGSGQTIAIVNAFDAPSIAADLHAFDVRFGLPDPPSFRKVSQTGSVTALPAANSRWAVETSLEVEWTHALAPQANILLVEARDNSLSNLFAGIRFAGIQPGVSVISLGFSASERPQELLDDATFRGLTGITVVAGVGDDGQVGYPAASPDVVSVGGTTLRLNRSRGYDGESAWEESGSGFSKFEAKPSYQSALPSSRRAVPDVAFDADPESGVPVYDSGSTRPWMTVGGTGLSASAWAAIFALTNQSRAQAGLAPLDGPTQSLPNLYKLPSSDFHAIGGRGDDDNDDHPGRTRIDGRGSPRVNLVVHDLAHVPTSSVVQPPTNLMAAAGTLSVSLSWTASAGATTYNVYRGTSPGGEGSTPVASGLTTPTYTDSGLSSGTTYYYEVTAVSGTSESGRSAEVSATTPAPPAAPTGVSGIAGNTQVGLTWSAVAGAVSYNVYRGSTPGGEGPTPVATGITTTSYTDTGLTDGVTYFYRVTAVGAAGEGAPSAEVSTTPQFLVLAINAGGGSVGSFVADTDFVGNPPVFATGAIIDTSGVFQPAPQAVYQTMRFSDPPGFSYDLVGLTPGATYTIRLDFVEPTVSGTGLRIFNVTLNGAAFLINFDIFATAGGLNKALAETGTATADANGQIIVGFSNIVNDSSVCGIEVYASTPVAPPTTPANLTAASTAGGVALTWSGVAGAASYNVYRGTSPGGEGAVPLATGVTNPSYTDVTAIVGSTYYYQVSAVNLGGEGVRSGEQSAMGESLPPYQILAIDAGGGTVGSYAADTDYAGNTLVYVTAAPIDTSGVLQPAPQAVYQSMRYSPPPGFSYDLTGLTPGDSYVVRLHFIEPTMTGPGQRVFNVTLNGAAFLTNFDIFATTGGMNKALAEVGTVSADASGQIVVGFSNIVNDPLVCGIEVYAGSPVALPAAPTNVTATPSGGLINLTWTAVPGAARYNVYRGTSPGGEGAIPLATGVTGPSFSDATGTAGTTYYYRVSAVNVGGVSSLSAEVSAAPQYLIEAIDAGGGTVGSFAADTGYVGNTLVFVTGATIDTSGVPQAAPLAVYQSMRYSPPPGFSYDLTGLTPGTTYTIRLSFVEPTMTSAGQRVFNVTLNGAAFLTNFDIFATSGGMNRALDETGTATADASGQIVVGLSNIVNDPLVCGIEVYANTPG